MASLNNNNTLPKRLAISVAVTTTFLAGYGGRQAYAGTCYGTAGTYFCTGAATGTDTTIILNSSINPLVVTTEPEFGITTASGNAIELLTLGSTSFTDSNTSLITGFSRGINAKNQGYGATSITTTGTVTGTTDSSIYAYNATSATDLIINTAAVAGQNYGILAFNSGTGATSITGTGTVTGTTGRGILARNSNTGTNLTISTAAVTGGVGGIFALNYGTGATSITSSGAVTGTNVTGRGIHAYNASSATSLTINIAAVTGGFDGILANNFGKGATSITATGTVTGTNGSGINAYNDSSATSLTISTAAVTGGTGGIRAINYGTSDTIITTMGIVTGTTFRGIYAFNDSSANNLTISTTAVTGETDGIHSRNYGTGATSISSTGVVSGTISYGIYARNYTNTSNLTINTAAVTGGYVGISAFNRGTGATSITSTGTVSGSNGRGILAYNASYASDLTINTADVTGGRDGIFASNIGTGNTSITSTGAVTGGGTGLGIRLTTLAGSTNTITLNAGAGVSAASGNAITMTLGANSLMVNSGASVTGSVDLGGIANTMTLNGGTLNVASGFALNVNGNLVNSNGIFNLRDSTGATFNTATLTGNYTGGGQLLLNANFATNTADKLNITGNILAGNTSVSVNDVSTGASTGTAITLVSVGGATSQGDFVLAAPVVNGAFNYNKLALVGQDWVLQSVSSAPATTDAPATPAFTPFAASFEAFSQSLIGLESLNSLYQRTQQRIGASNTLGGASSGDTFGEDRALWASINRGYRDIDNNQSTTGANFDTNHWKGQVGIDIPMLERQNGHFVLGVNAGYGQASTSVKSTAGQSSIDTDNYSIGLSGTWLATSGLYVDTQLQHSWYSSDLSAGGAGAGNVRDVKGDGNAISVEIGKEISINNHLSITPQMQLAYARVSTDNFTGANNERVNTNDGKSLRARLGTLITKRFTEDGATQGFVELNAIHEFKDQTRVNVSGAQLTNVIDDWSGQLGVGVRHTWIKGMTSYELNAALTATTSLNNFGDSKAAQGRLGFVARF